ncbi:MAG TPA: sigma 54-interacting transcriptional regulator [Candidatus Acidoferrales bacterium]|nr:sigma 54-interacting transcriptional regulator [Candidatus Acidoferrales bacterium]
MDLRPGPEQRRAREDETSGMRRARQDNEDWYQDLVEHSHDLLCIHDLRGRLLSVNPAPAHALGYTVEELLQIPMRDLVPPEFRPQFDAYLSEIGRTGESRGLLALMTRSGQRRIWQYYNTLRTDGVAAPIVRGIAHDVTEQMRTEKLLRETGEGLLSEVRQSDRTIRKLELFRTLLDHSNEAIEVVDPETLRFIDANERAWTGLGYSREEILSLRIFDVDPEITQTSVAKMKAELQRSGFLVMESIHRRKDGSSFPVEVSMKWVHLERDYVVTIVRDLTERNQAEKRLREYERVVECLEEMIVVIDRDYRYAIANRAFLNYRSMRKEEVIGRRIDEVLNKEIFDSQIKDKLDECFRGKVVAYDMKFTYPKLGERQLYVTYFPIEGPTGVDRIGAIVQDVTASKQSERMLRRSQENYRMFVSQSSEGIFREDLDEPIPIDLPEEELIYRILHDSYLGECNDAMAAMYGLKSADELRGKRLTEMVLPDDPHNIELTRHYIRTGFRVFDRESHEIDIHGNPKVFVNSLIGSVENGMLVGTWGIQRDVTAKVKLEEFRQQAEEALRRNVVQLEGVTEELRLAKEKLSEEKLYLEQAIDTELGFGEIIGRSDALKGVMEKVAKVAPSDATVLLLGETGTGKELVARAIHRMSKRKDNSFIKLNCAAIPSGLLESELFGHEKGAFTGAVAKKLGRIELADLGTLFLDEIGEISLDLQPKLLRVLQDQEFERLGGTQTLKVNFRLVAATNRELLDSVNRREFRSDLYYRLNVFPLRTPPLRERREDIPLLIEHFVRKYANRMNKSILSIPARTMETLVRWAWPGNIRELENFVERSVILTPGLVLQVPLSELHAELDSDEPEMLRDKERQRILRALRACNGQLGGPNGAAARLGLKRTTLQSKLNGFGISPGGYRA